MGKLNNNGIDNNRISISNKDIVANFERISDIFISVDLNFCFTYFNKKAIQYFKLDPVKMIGKSILSEFPSLVDTQFYKALNEAKKNQEVGYYNGYSSIYNFWAESSFYPSEEGISIIIRDVSEKVNAENKIKQSNRLYLFISNINQLIIRATNQETLFKEVCRIAVENGGFKMAWIGLLEDKTNKIIPEVIYGEENGYLNELKNISLNKDIPEGRGPTGTAIREQRNIFVNDIENDIGMVLWKEAAISRDFQSLMAIPLIKFDKVIGAFTFYSSQKNFFDKSEMNLLEEVTKNVSFALEILDKEIIRKKAEENLIESEKKYKQSQEIGHIGSWEFDLESRVFWGSDEAKKIYGFEIEAQNLNYEDVTACVIDRTHVDQAFNDLINETKIYDIEFEIQTKNSKKTKIIHSIAELVKNENGKAVKISGVLSDITHRKQVENAIKESQLQYEQLFNQMLDGVMICEVVYDKNGLPMDHVFVNGNRAFEKLTGYLSAEQSGKNSQTFPIKWPPAILEKLYNVAITGVPIQYERFNESLGRTYRTTVFSPRKGQFAHIFYDITDIKNSEEKILQLSKVIEQSPVSVVITDAKGNIEYVNQKFIDLTGYSFEEAIGNNPRILKSEEKTMDEYKMLWQDITSGKTWNGKFHNKKKDGTLYWEKAIIFPIKNLHGEIINFVAIKEDISEVVKIEHSLESTSKLLDQTSILSKIGGWEVDLETMKIIWTEETYRIFEVDHSFTPTIESLNNFYSPETISNTNKFVQIAIEQGKEWDYQFPLTTAKGKEIWIKGKGTPVQKNGKVVKLTGYFQDITERIHIEKQYTDLFDFSPQPMWMSDLKTFKFIRVNKAAIENYGYSEEEFLSMTLFDIRPETEFQKVKGQIEELERLNGKMIFLSNIHRKKSGELINVEVYINKIFFDGKEVTSTIAIDITEKNKLELAINKAILKTQEDERYEIGGELHDNISQILVASQLSLGMIKKSIEPSNSKYLEQSSRYTRLALEEIRNLSHRLAPVIFEDKNLEDAIRNLFRDMNVENNYKISISFDTSFNEYKINAEIQLNLYRILQEQLKNILKYSKATEIEVDTHISNNIITMRIADNGIGFDPATVKKGIGLANIKRRAEIFDGKSRIISSEGKGCIIDIEIPIG